MAARRHLRWPRASGSAAPRPKWPALHGVVLALLAAATAASAQSGLTSGADAANIQSERHAVEQRFEAARLDCAGRFALTACLDRARAARRHDLDALAKREAVLDDAQRRARAAERLRAIDDKVRAAAQARSGSAAAPAAAGVPAAASSAVVATPEAARASAPPTSTAPLRRAAPRAATSASVPSVAEIERRRADYQRRQQAAQAHRRAALQRDAERTARKPPAASLPLPAAASVPATPAR